MVGPHIPFFRQAVSRPRCVVAAVWVGLAITVAGWTPARGQEPVRADAAASEAAPAPAREGGGPRIAEGRPELFYLKGEDGRLVPVPGFRYRDFVELFRLKEGLPNAARPPAAVLELVTIRADLADAAESGVAAVSVECTVRQTEAGWAAVPLALDGLLLAAPPRHEGPGRVVVDPAPAGAGFRAWFESATVPAADARHRVTLDGRIAVDRNGDQETLRLDVPAATASAVEIRSPRRDPEVVVEPAAPDRRVTVAADAKGSVVRVAGLAGRVRLRIGGRGRPAEGTAAVPRAEVDSVVRIDGRAAFTDTRIVVENLPTSATSLRIALPAGMVLREVRPPAMLRSRAGAEEQPIIEVDGVRNEAGAAVVELRCERPVDTSGARTFNAAGFAVEGVEAWRQRGRISLAIDGDWQADWTGSLRQIDPPAAARPAGFVAAFSYDDVGSATLDVRVRQRRSRVVVEPEYRYEVGAERIGFVASLQVATSGAPVPGIEVAIDPSWVIEEVGPAAVVEDGWTFEAGRLVIPFAQGLSGKARVEIRGGRQIDRDAERLDWILPVPGPQKTVTVGPAAVFIDAASDIELQPDGDETKGLFRQTAAAVPRAEGERATLAYRFDGSKGRFVAQRRFLPRRVDADVESVVDVDDRVIRVVETIRLDVLHVPLEFIELLVPDQAAGSLEVRQEKTLLDALDIVGEAATDGQRRFRALLARRLLGRGDVQVAYELPLSTLAAGSSVVIDVPFVQPADARIARQTVVVTSVKDLVAEVTAPGWKREPDSDAAQSRRAWLAARSQTGVPLAVTRRRAAAGGDVAVEAAWLRTAAFPDRREDVYTYALAGGAGSLPVTIPAALRAAASVTGAGTGLTVSLDGESLPLVPDDDGLITIDLPPRAAAERSRWLLQIRAVVPWQRGPLARWTAMPTRVVLDPPLFADGVEQSRFYWEVDSPPDEYLIGAPRYWTVQQRWEWSRLGPDRVPVVDRQALANWVRAAGTADGAAAARDDADLPGRERRAVFSGVGRPGTARPWLVPAWFIVAVWSGATLAGGLAFVYWPAVRRTSIVLAVGGCAALATANFPDVAPLWALGAAPGLLLAICAWALRAAVEGGTRTPVVPVPAGMASASSLTRIAGSAPSLLVSPTVVGSSATAAGRGTR